MFPEIEPYATGMLDAGDGQRLYWETCGNPNGKPALVLHGGPGGGCNAGMRRFFDPSVFRVVLFDQRGCGRSEPLASDPDVDLNSNTTMHLLRDIEKLREHLEIDAWLVFGASWGTTLALAYAQQHLERVTEMVLVSTGTTSASEVRWLTRDVGRLFPEAWASFRDGVPVAQREGDLSAAYSRLLNHGDASVREKAALDWCAWEEAHVSLRSGPRNPRWDDPAFRLRFARLVTHYWSHAAWLEDGALLRGAAKLAGIPGILIHGRFDVSSPLDVPWAIANEWPGSQLVVVDDAGHSLGLSDAMLAAIARFER